MFFKRFSTTTLIVAVICSALFLGVLQSAKAVEPAVAIPLPTLDNPKAAGALQTAVLAGGCFWGVQGVYQHVHGVRKVLSGYSGGDQSKADYHSVSTGTTGHAESVQVIFDPKVVSYGEILQVYFSVAHDPTLLNRQGPDSGTQYRSNIFYADDTQKKIAVAYIAQLDKAKLFRSPIVTRVDPLKAFYPAEDYHQDFLVNNPSYPYIVINDIPKVNNLKKVLPGLYQDQAITLKEVNI
ncbi:peptide-methionine (S)-S-oxide reductase MsrA [Methyloradius palustris]|uniref:Peptide methionine sulfoxide reductase MsrA n=1 Tax=Methyloradius palustris TaxID=2778876 RepID=A0A8D5G3K0_9PROT|nr:peptide-methionine (S)-S-oxide reductase MsrA [Methyloradius palustris]BCM25110.1 peptide methionine sulfoxide reductase MsrA [Methyloradius palustris]